MHIKNTQCLNALDENGYTLISLETSVELKKAVEQKDYPLIDQIIQVQTMPGGNIFKALAKVCNVESIEFIISLREAQNEWEEDGIWHDDGSRIMAFSLSLTQHKPGGGILEFRKKGELQSQKIETPDFGKMIIFKTGIDGYEHKINAVTQGSRLIIAGWCYPNKSC